MNDYFQLDTVPSLQDLYQEWSKNDANRMAQIAACIPGVRMVRQHPVECLFSFLASSNNNIPRITQLLSNFRQSFGTKLLSLPARQQIQDDNAISSCVTLYSFPTLEQLEHVTEQDLRDMGWGYRAKYVMQTKQLLQTLGGLEYLMRLREESSHAKVQDELIQFVGIGRKVADCISLFSLDQTNAIPVDVHVWNMARRDFGPTISNQLCQAKSLTPTLYKMVGDLFRARYPTHAGWAHSLLFVAELPSFRPMLPPDMVIEMDEWRAKEAKKKAAAKAIKESLKGK
eukprot:scaffold41710_cov55-Attheya_sp.AAC.3